MRLFVEQIRVAEQNEFILNELCKLGKLLECSRHQYRIESIYGEIASVYPSMKIDV